MANFCHYEFLSGRGNSALSLTETVPPGIVFYIPGVFVLCGGAALKKRVISFVLVLVLMFTGSFSLLASAETGIVHKLFDIWYHVTGSSYIIDHYSDMIDGGRDVFHFVSDFLSDSDDSGGSSSHASDASVSIQFRNTDYDDIGVSVGFSPEMKSQCPYDLDNALTFCWCAEGPTLNMPDQYNCPLQVYYHCVDKSDAEFVVYNYNPDTQYFTLAASKSIRSFYIRDDIKLKKNSAGDWYVVHNYFWGGYKTDRSIWSGSLPQTGQPSTYDSRTHSQCNYMVYSDFAYHELVWSGNISIDTYDDILGEPTYINFELRTDRDVVPEVDGTFSVVAGILFDDGFERTFAGSYISFDSFNNGHFRSYQYNFDEFCYYIFRKHCFHDGYVAFIRVTADSDHSLVYSFDLPFDLIPPGGIFDDIEDPPDWKDYEPEPSDPPDPPEFDTNIFNFTYNTNNYNNFIFQTIQNFSYSGGGSGGSGGGGGGGTGNDDSSVPDDSSSCGDSSSGDSSVDDSGSGGGVNINPEIDFDFGLLTAFLNWFTDAFFTLVGNISGALGALLNNFNLFVSDLFHFFDGLKLYLTGFLKSSLEYLSQLIFNFNTDFNRCIKAFAKYIGACIDVTDFNIQIVVSNLKQYFDTQFIPDSDNVNFILSDCLGWYYQIQQLLASKNYSAQAFTLYLDPFDYTFTFDDVELASQLKNICTVIILGCTALKCVRIGFQTFGINIGGGESDDS